LNALNCLYKTREINPEYKEIDSIFEEINSTLEEISLKSQDLSPKEIFCVKGFVYFNKNELNSAVDEWEKAVKLNNRPISNEKLALSNKILNAYIIKTKRNIRLLEEKRKTDELLQIGADLFLKKDYEKAMKFFNQALKSDKENTSAKEYIEKCKIELKKLNSSRKQQDKQERLKTSQAGNDIKTADSHYQQGLIYYASGQLELAKKEWEIALKYNPDNERIKSALSKIQKELK